MTRFTVFIRTALLCAVLAPAVIALAAPSDPSRLPNIVVIFTDDQGYQDVGCFGAPGIKTPHLDAMANRGMRLTDFHVAAPVCSPSRAALMTGCYPQRVCIPSVLSPRSRNGLAASELTLAEVVKQRGYATAIVGKWHLGHQRRFLPTRHGFDEYFGLPYSNDMWPPNKRRNHPPLPLIRNEEPVEYVDNLSEMADLTTRYTQYAVSFIKRNRDRPFFLYFPHTMPHVPLAVSSKYKDTSPRGLFGDAIQEIDWSVGQVLDTLKRLGLEKNTLVVFTSDNGPSLHMGPRHAGSAGPLREGKGTTFEGGFRVPCIMQWPGRIPAGATCDELVTAMDLLPTVAQLVGVSLPKDRMIDGHDVWPLLSGQEGAKSPCEVLAYYRDGRLDAVRSGRWKLHVPHPYLTVAVPGKDGKRGKRVRKKIGLSLFDLKNDVGETTNVAKEHPEVVARLQKLVDQFRDDLGDSAKRRKGKNVRPLGRSPARPEAKS